MAAYWPSRLADPFCRGADFAFANMMNTYQKFVFSSTLKIASWNNSILAAGHLQEQVDGLKKMTGKNSMVYGSTQLVNGLIQSGRVDEYQLWLHPFILGNGTPLFRPGILPSPCPQHLQWVKLQRFDGGVLRIDYQATVLKNGRSGVQQ